MKITEEQLRQIIKEELCEGGEAAIRGGTETSHEILRFIRDTWPNREQASRWVQQPTILASLLDAASRTASGLKTLE